MRVRCLSFAQATVAQPEPVLGVELGFEAAGGQRSSPSVPSSPDAIERLQPRGRPVLRGDQDLLRFGLDLGLLQLAHDGARHGHRLRVLHRALLGRGFVNRGLGFLVDEQPFYFTAGDDDRGRAGSLGHPTYLG